MSDLSSPAETTSERENRATADKDQAGRFRTAFFRVAPAMFLGALDQTIVAAALPAIALNLSGLTHLSWVVTAYLLTATIASPIYGKLGDAYGRQRMLIGALALFIGGSIVCTVAHSFAILVLGRALQGFGGGGLMTLAQAVMGEVVTPKERGRFQGWFGANFALASTLGPTAGGYLSEHYGWRSVFSINVPLGVLATIAAFRVKASRGTGMCRLDYAGAALFVGATVALLAALSLAGSKSGWTSPLPLVLVAVAAGGYLLLARVEARTAEPLISPTLLDEPVVWRSILTVLLFASVLFGLIVQLPLFFQTVFHVSPTASGMMLIPLTLAQVGVSTASGIRISKTGRPRPIMIAGLATVTAGFLALVAGTGHSQLFVALVTVVIGAGLGTTMPAAQTMVQWAGGPQRLGVSTASLSFGRSMGGMIGAALTSSVLLGVLHGLGPGALRATPQVWTAFRWMFLALAVLSALATALAASIQSVDLAAAPPD
jgi:EmrB/QacA subfamily drug resistance transporter